MVIFIIDMTPFVPRGKTMKTNGEEKYCLKAPYGPLKGTPLPHKQNNCRRPCKTNNTEYFSCNNRICVRGADKCKKNVFENTSETLQLVFDLKIRWRD